MEGSGALPSDRYQLFWKYFQTIYDRESAKQTGHRRLFSQHRQAIEAVHASTGLSLQIQAQSPTDTVPELPAESFRLIVEQELRRLGHDQEIPRISEQIVEASTSRLVLIIPTPSAKGVMFEIRSLQELMAARSLTEGNDAQVSSRLARLAPNANWRNTWIFMAGRIFSEGLHHRNDLVTAVVEQVDSAHNWPGWACPSGSVLASDLLDDGMVSTLPRWKRRLVDVAMSGLNGPVPLAMHRVQRGLQAAMSDPDTTAQIRTGFLQYDAGPPLSRRLAQWLLRDSSFGPPIHQIGRLSPDEPFWKIEEPCEVFPASKLLAEVITRHALTDRCEMLNARAALDVVGQLMLATHSILGLIPAAGSRVSVEDRRNLALALADSETEATLKTVIDGLGSAKWALLYSVGVAVEPHLARDPASLKDLESE